MRIDEENNIIYFDNDEEFYDYCVETYSINRRVRDHRVRKSGWNFSDWYQSHVNEATKIVILDDDSTILRRGGMVAGRAGITRKINAYRVNPVEPDDPDLLMEVGEKRESKFRSLHDDEGTGKNNRIGIIDDMKAFKENVGELKKSSMFHMSLGSKELFHSNFLHWLSIVDWDYFIQIMHHLADQRDSFWWEKLDRKNIDVRREDKNFDLSIWVLYSTKMVKSTDSSVEEDGEKIVEDKKEIWIPVLVLENKMKSLPYSEQLEDYVNKAFKIWMNSTNVKDAVINPNLSDVAGKWKMDCEITFILLTLLDSTNKQLSDEIESDYEKKRPSIKIAKKFKWNCKNYYNLWDGMRKCSRSTNTDIDNNFYNSIVDDYLKFIKNLYYLASREWMVQETDNYISKVYPQKLDLKNCEKQKLVALQNLRIADIKEKICYDQLLNLLLGRLSFEKIYPNRVLKGSFSDKNNVGKFLCRTNYFHNVGLFEIIFMIKKKKNANDEPFYLTIQIQGNYYMHGISGKNIVKTEKNAYGKSNVIGDFFAKKGYKLNDWKKKLSFFFDLNKGSSLSKNCFPNSRPCLELKHDGEYYKYDTNFVYQCAEIQYGTTVGDLIELIVEDVTNINNEAKHLRSK